MKDESICSMCLFSPATENLIEEAPYMCITCKDSNKYHPNARIPDYFACGTCVSRPIKTNKNWCSASRLACVLCHDGNQHDLPMKMELPVEDEIKTTCFNCEWGGGPCELGYLLCYNWEDWALKFMGD